MKKTMNMKKRLIAIIMSMAMTTSMTISSLAVPNPRPGVGADGDFSLNTGNTVVSLVGMNDAEADANLSAEVPINLLLAINGNGEVRGPDNYRIKNTSNGKSIKVIRIGGSGTDNFALANLRPDDHRVDLGRVTITPTLGGNTGAAIPLSRIHSPHTPNAGDWTMQAPGTGTNSSVTIKFGGAIDDIRKLPADSTNNNGGTTAFYLKFTIEKV